MVFAQLLKNFFLVEKRTIIKTSTDNWSFVSDIVFSNTFKLGSAHLMGFIFFSIWVNLRKVEGFSSQLSYMPKVGKFSSNSVALLALVISVI